MQKTIRGRVYDTETAQLVGHHINGLFGNPEGYEEFLFRTPEGYYFLFGRGGEASPYKTEKLKAVSAKAADAWLSEQ